MKNKIFSFINVFGLSIGLTCCMLISLYINHETSYDRYHRNANEIFQLGTIFINDGDAKRTANTPAPMAAAMKHEFPEILETTRLMALFAEDKTLLQYQTAGGAPASFYETKGYIADSTFFRLFDYQFIEGDPAHCLDNANTSCIKRRDREKVFWKNPRA